MANLQLGGLVSHRECDFPVIGASRLLHSVYIVGMIQDTCLQPHAYQPSAIRCSVMLETGGMRLLARAGHTATFYGRITAPSCKIAVNAHVECPPQISCCLNVLDCLFCWLTLDTKTFYQCVFSALPLCTINNATPEKIKIGADCKGQCLLEQSVWALTSLTTRC